MSKIALFASGQGGVHPYSLCSILKKSCKHLGNSPQVGGNQLHEMNHILMQLHWVSIKTCSENSISCRRLMLYPITVMKLKDDYWLPEWRGIGRPESHISQGHRQGKKEEHVAAIKLLVFWKYEGLTIAFKVVWCKNYKFIIQLFELSS